MRFFTLPSFAGVLFIMLLASVPTAAFSEDETKAHVAVVQFSNQTNSASYDAACKAATDTLLLTLQQLGRYRVQSLDTAGSGEDALRAMAEEQHLDFIIYGKLSKPEAGGIDCRLSVFDRAKGKTALSQSKKAAGVLDIFDTTDDLVVSVLEAMTGTHIGFGSLTLTNTGEKGSYTVLVDGSSAGSNLDSLEKILKGKRIITIVQKRMFGDREIAKSSVDVKEGDTVGITFSVPYLMDDEKQKVESLKASIDAGWTDSAHLADVDTEVTQFGSLFGDVSYSPKLATYKDEAKQLTGEWALRKSRLAIENSAWDPKLELLDEAGAIYTGAKAYPDPAKIKRAFGDNALLVATLFELEAGEALASGDLDKGLECFGNALTVSTKYLGGKRMTDYAYAITMLQSIQEQESAGTANSEGDRNLKTVFGDTIRAGQRFYGLKDQVVAGKAYAVVASDFTKTLSMDGGDYADAPVALEPATETRALRVQPKGDETPTPVMVSTRTKLLFIQDGFAPFGKVALGSAPGAIEVSATVSRFILDKIRIRASLDGGEEVDLPHVYENVPSGSHTIRIPDVYAGSTLFAGVEENVTVEPGKRLVFNRTLEVGHAKIHVEDIPEGSTLLIDGDEQTLSQNPAGGMAFDGIVEAGSPKIEVVHDNKDWYTISELLNDVSSVKSFSVKDMYLQITLQRKSIKFTGKEEDWEGIEPIFKASQLINNHPKISGSQIAGGSICRDDKYLYTKIDFSNGKPAWVQNCVRDLVLFQRVTYQLQEEEWGNGTMHTDIWYPSRQQESQVGSCTEGSSFIEMRFPLSWLSKDFEFSKPIRAWFQFSTKEGIDPNRTLTSNIIIGK
jgi:hypothetical protein